MEFKVKSHAGWKRGMTQLSVAGGKLPGTARPKYEFTTESQERRDRRDKSFSPWLRGE